MPHARDGAPPGFLGPSLRSLPFIFVPGTSPSARVDRVSSPLRTFTLGRAYDIVEPLLARLAAACPGIRDLTPAGGIRRFEPLVDDLTIVGWASDPESALAAVSGLPELTILQRTPRRLELLDHQHNPIDIHIAARDEYGTVLVTTTGSERHVAALHKRRGRIRLCSTEAEVYADAGLAWVPPEMRQGTGEVEAAARGALPVLLEESQIRGDLHMHSTYSDGQDTLETMVAGAQAAGYDYIAITDHSERAGAARTVAIEALERQRDEIAALREQYPGMEILHGIEVDIMPDGSLDFPDTVLATLDIVLASLHDAAGQSPRALTRRCIGAIRHPLVSVITHPANRIVGRRPGYALDYPAVFAAAVEAGTALEIDGAPSHMDMDGEQARAAVEAGVTVVVDGDAHRAAALRRHMRFGVGTARRGWVEARHVLNTRAAAEVREFVTAKRR